jgi:hypothetical protein
LRDLAVPDVRILERRRIGASFRAWPQAMRFISPSFPGNAFGITDAISFDSSPAFALKREHPSGAEYATYLEQAAEVFGLNVTTGIDVEGLEPDGDEIVLHTNGGEIHARFVIWAAGQFQYPNRDAISGAEHGVHASAVKRWTEHPGDEVVVIGGYEIRPCLRSTVHAAALVGAVRPTRSRRFNAMGRYGGSGSQRAGCCVAILGAGSALTPCRSPAHHRSCFCRGYSMVRITLPDGAQREFQTGVSGADVATAIAPSLRKRAVAMVVDDVLHDLADPIEVDAHIELITREDARALDLIRHDAAHVLAQAVQELFPGTQATIGPVIDNGFFYDFARDAPFTLEDLPMIEARMHDTIARDAPFKKEVWTREKAKTFFRERGETFKVELVDAIPQGEEIKIYRQGGWLDLCRGPHMTSTGKTGSAFKLTKVDGAYWRGDANNRMLTRIYGTAFATQAELDAHLTMLEEAEKRDHRRLGREMDLYHFQEEAPGSVFWHPKRWTLFQTLISYMRERQTAAGYVEVNTPDIMDRHLWETSGHWQNYRQHMFTTKTEDDRDFALKPMNCPGQGLKSYRDLPLKIAEFGKVHRYEPSGALHGLLRVRSFTQDDAHIFCTEDQLTTECIKVNDLVLSIYEDFGFRDILGSRISNRTNRPL